VLCSPNTSSPCGQHSITPALRMNAQNRDPGLTPPVYSFPDHNIHNTHTHSHTHKHTHTHTHTRTHTHSSFKLSSPHQLKHLLWRSLSTHHLPLHHLSPLTPPVSPYTTCLPSHHLSPLTPPVSPWYRMGGAGTDST